MHILRFYFYNGQISKVYRSVNSLSMVANWIYLKLRLKKNDFYEEMRPLLLIKQDRICLKQNANLIQIHYTMRVHSQIW